MRARDANEQTSFNSKLVRLKGYTRGEYLSAQKRFQFQTGSIKRSNSLSFIFEDDSFNSKLVRLKVISYQLRDVVKGRFNSKLVRLKESVFLPMHVNKIVSIPNWFD